MRRYYIYTHEELEWPIIAVTVDPRICGAIGSRARFHAEKKNGGEGRKKEFGIPENVTEVEDARATNVERERKKGRRRA